MLLHKPYSLQQSAKAQKELDDYKGKVASLKEAIEEHGLDANSLFTQAGIEIDEPEVGQSKASRVSFQD